VIKYKHTNIAAKDWKSLAGFYQTVFECEPVPPERHLSEDWLARGTGVRHAALEGMHLRLPGWGAEGPTLEIYQYHKMKDKPKARANRAGFAHLAFEVDDVAAVTEKALQHGARALGALTTAEVAGVGRLTFIYITDPEDNIIEIQAWG
jgi:predicted enzyme related to lactoylglutathione lyase